MTHSPVLFLHHPGSQGKKGETTSLRCTHFPPNLHLRYTTYTHVHLKPVSLFYSRIPPPLVSLELPNNVPRSAEDVTPRVGMRETDAAREESRDRRAGPGHDGRWASGSRGGEWQKNLGPWGAGPSAVGNTLAAIAEGSMAPRCATGRNRRAEVLPS